MKKVAAFINKLAGAIAPGVDWTAIAPSTWVRWILAGLMTINNVLIVFGLTPIEVSENDLYFVVSVIVNILVLIVNTYKDNPTSKEGIFTNNLMKILKSSATDENALMTKIQELLDNMDEEPANTVDAKSDPNTPRSPSPTEQNTNTLESEDVDNIDEEGDADLEEAESDEPNA